ncbi:MAG: EAL domain-containing protein [Gammaproteobacteria bacterium]|nr:EAL domain-containing protein [Gammaproteobacteria bacterium]
MTSANRNRGGIASRIRGLVLTVTATALFVSVAIHAVLEYQFNRTSLVDQLHVLAKVIGDNSAAAITFDDRKGAHEVLRTLRAEPDVYSATLVLPDGRMFAREQWIERAGEESHDAAWLTDTLSHIDTQAVARFDSGDIDLVMPIVLDGDVVSFLHIEGSLRRLERQSLFFIGTAAAIFLLLMGGAYLVSNRLQRRISGPIRELAGGMQSVSRDQDYTLRVTAESDDEVGDLIDGFNEMLGEIERRDRTLAEYQRELEHKVEARTADLAEAKDLAEAGSRAKSEFLATMSHEIRTPMNGVLGMTELLLGSGLTPRQQRLAETAYRSAESLLGVINNILDFSKIEAGRLDLNDSDVELRPLFDDTLELLADQAHRKGIELIADLPPNLLSRARCDATRLRQILVNLLGNAVKFTQHGEVRLRVRTAPINAQTHALQIEISDTGPGIAEEQQQRIFDAFFQAESTSTRRFGGTGLGLTITRRLVTLMGGEMTLDSHPGEGTRFTLSIPVDKAEIGDAAPVQLREMSGVRVLIVDDHKTNREILCNQVASWGMQESCASDGPEALALARNAASEGKPYQVMLLDWQMPGMDGMQLLESIKSDDMIPQANIIMLSSAGDDDVARQARAKGVDCYLTKPVRQDRLLDCLLRTRRGLDADPRKPASAPERPLFDARVLLAEDNYVNQEVALGMLELLGCQVDIAEDGQQAIDAYRDKPYDLVLMDCHMPTVDGFEAAAAIRDIENQKGAPRTPIIALTADIQKGVQAQCAQAGMDGYLSKPFDQLGLSGILQQYLHVSEKSAANRHTTLLSIYRVPPLLDRQALQVLHQLGEANGRDVIGKVANLFLEQAPKQLEGMRTALAGGDSESVRQLAHSLKSSSANLGAMQVSQSAAALEAAARDGRTQLFDELGEQLHETATAALDAIRDMLTSRVANDTQAPEQTDADENFARILIVDDDAGFRVTAEEALRAEAFATCSAGDGEQAIRLVEQRKPDLILLDAVMDGMDGFDACRRIRNTANGRNVPIIMVTGLDDPAALERAFQVGATGFATKPVSFPALIQRIRFVLRASANETALRDHQTMLQTAQRVARLGYWRWSPDSGSFELSANLCELCGIATDQAPTSLDGYLKLLAEDQRANVRTRLLAAVADGQPGTFDYRLEPVGGEPITVHQDLEFIDTPGGRDVLGTVQDVTAQRASEEQIRKMAYYDALTGLASRSHLMQHLEDTIRIARRRNEEFTIMFLDLDGFKDVNDSLGHDIGDFMLVSIAKRLQGIVRDVDFVARLGGDEFCILLKDHGDELDAAEVAARCLEVVNEPVELGKQPWRPHVSIGLARFPIDGDSAGDLLKAADSAMYAAKQGGKHRYAFYRPEMTVEAERRLAHEQQLRNALDEEQFELYYQPQIDMRSGRITGVEALARWQHPDGGMVLPGQFIGTLERIGLIGMFGNWVIRQACAQSAAWTAAGITPIRVAVNISPLHFHDPSIVDTVRMAIADSGIEPRLLELEITETSVQSDTKAMVVLQQLQALGVRIAIDDFGTGYSSLGSLKHLPINTLKVDRLFIKDMLNRNEDAVMLGTIIGLAHALGYTVVAEGVEQQEQVTVLAALHCDLSQGFYFSHPLPITKVTDLLKRDLPYGGNHAAHKVAQQSI